MAVDKDGMSATAEPRAPVLIAPWYALLALGWHAGSSATREATLRRLRAARAAEDPHRSLEQMVRVLEMLGLTETQRLYLLLMEQRALLARDRTATPQSIAGRLIDAVAALRRHENDCRQSVPGTG